MAADGRGAAARGMPGVALHDFRAAQRHAALLRQSSAGANDAAAFQQRLARSIGLSSAPPRPPRAARPQPGACAAARHLGGAGAALARVQALARDVEYVAVASTRARGDCGAPPTPRMSDGEWQKVEAAAAGRGDFRLGCPICLEAFSADASDDSAVLLSCSHTFHRACLESAERCLRAAAHEFDGGRRPSSEKKCPICRKARYEFRATGAAAAETRGTAATRCQALLRGFVARRLRHRLRRAFYGSGGGDEKLRRRFLESELATIGKHIERVYASHDDSIDALLAESDRALSTSALVFCDDRPRPPQPPLKRPETPPPPPTLAAWRGIRRHAALIAEAACAVCLGDLDHRKKCVLLSCAHIFHAKCLKALEDFNVGEDHLCPCCRGVYHTAELVDSDAPLHDGRLENRRQNES
ncbi:hypothetical protein M885DRAFT_32436 [Pelagophyceae sp. CCMP2097]|nr:hypothetical protein M885DRAFT_32436 [Pelagophyceae sp. CCMP2097]